MHQRLEELTEYLARSRRAVLDAASAVPAGLWTGRSAPESWSVSENLEHLHRVEQGIAGLLAKRIGRARESGHPAETEIVSVLGTLGRLRVSDRGRRLVSPENVAPTENPDRETVLSRLAASRAALLAAIESGDGLALGSIRHTHSRFGELDLYEWILFVAEHEGRHAAQIAEVAERLVPSS